VTGGRARALLAVIVTLVLGGAILGVGQGGDGGGSTAGSTAASGSGAAGGSGGAGSGGDAAVRALGVLGQDGRRAFQDEGCGGCHRLADAGTSGRIGPDLDAVLSDEDEAEIRESIVEPQAEATPGFSDSLMPDRYGEQLSAKELDALVKYLAAATKG
jgi:cytochrome c oxidase subunit 2